MQGRKRHVVAGRWVPLGERQGKAELLLAPMADGENDVVAAKPAASPAPGPAEPQAAFQQHWALRATQRGCCWRRHRPVKMKAQRSS